MKSLSNPFELICKSKADAEIMQLKSHLLILLMESLRCSHDKRKDMAARLGCSEGEMSRIANGYLSSISIEKLLKHLSTVGIIFSSSLNADELSCTLIVGDEDEKTVR